MSPFMSTVTPVGLCSCPGDRPLTPKRILNWPSLENTWNQFHQRAPSEWNVSWPAAGSVFLLNVGALSHLYALIVAVSHHHSAVTRGWDSLQICELPFFSSPASLQTNKETKGCVSFDVDFQSAALTAEKRGCQSKYSRKTSRTTRRWSLCSFCYDKDLHGAWFEVTRKVLPTL